MSKPVDIAEVFISYFIQLSISITGIILLTASSVRRSHFSRIRDAWSGFPNKRGAIESLSHRRLNRARECLVSALHEFQRAQCFFGLATQTASIVVLFTDRLQVTNVVQAVSNFNFMIYVAMNNLYCIPFIYWYLRGNLEVSFYTLLLSLTSFILAFATTFIVATKNSIQDVHSLVSSPSFASCGNTSPGVTCSPSIGGDSAFPSTVLKHARQINNYDRVWPTLLMVVGVLQYFSPAYQKHLDTIRPFFQSRRALRISLRSLWFLSKLACFSWFLAGMGQSAIRLYAFKTFGGIDSAQWSIGQIVGITVFVPPVFEFLQLYLRKLFPFLYLKATPLTATIWEASGTAASEIPSHTACRRATWWSVRRLDSTKHSCSPPQMLSSTTPTNQSASRTCLSCYTLSSAARLRRRSRNGNIRMTPALRGSAGRRLGGRKNVGPGDAVGRRRRAGVPEYCSPIVQE